MLKRTAISLVALAASSAAAQVPARPDPADTKAPAPAATYESAFRDYKPYEDPEIARWRDVNNEVGRLNGHIGHVRMQATPGAKPPAKPDAHGGHRGHK